MADLQKLIDELTQLVIELRQALEAISYLAIKLNTKK
jgi:hypothetical protein